MLDKKTFIGMYKKAIGASQAAKMFDEVQSIQKKQETHSEVYLNEFGNEVHVKGDMVASLVKGETLKERIARFDKLAERVAAVRMARALGILPSEDIEEDVNDDTLLDDVEIRDDFGDIVEKPTVAEPEKSVAKATVPPMSAAEISGDEPVSAAASVASDMETGD